MTDVSHPLLAKGSGGFDGTLQSYVAHSLRADGFDASEGGTGRGTPLVPVQGVALRGREGGATAELTGDVMTALRCGGGGGDKPHVLAPVCFDETQITSKENRSNPQPGDPSHSLAEGARPPTLAFSVKDYGNDVMTDVAPTMRAMGHDGSHANAGGQLGIVSNWRVRRLTPRECERLQGFPDNHTDIPYRKRNWTPDGPRYKALGNSFAVNVVRWIGQRIQMVEDMEKDT